MDTFCFGFAYRNLKPFGVNRNRSRTRRHNRDTINVLLTEFLIRTVSYGSAEARDPLMEGGNRRSVTYNA